MKSFIRKASRAANECTQKAHVALVVGAMGLGMSDSALAAISIGDVGDNVGENSVGLSKAILRIFGLVGFGMAGMGLLKFRNAKQSGDGLGPPITMIVIGAGLLAIPVIIGVMSMTALGTDATTEMSSQLIE